MFRRVLAHLALVTALPLVLVVAPTASAAAATRPTLHTGHRGAAVLVLQQRLLALHYVDVGAADGVFGAKTFHAVVAFQKVQRLPRDGIVGPATWAKLDRPFRPTPRYRMTSSSVEVQISRQVVMLARDGRIRAIVDASTGSGRLYLQDGVWHRAVTPTGRFHVYAAYTGWRHSPLGWMYKPRYFYRGFAIHGSTFVPAYPDSHGCVRITVPTMDRIAGRIWRGIPVAVYG